MSKHGMSSQLARAKKKSGHAEENKFNAYFSEDSITSDSSNMNHSGASADCKVTVQSYKNKISDNLENITDFSVSLKSGKTIQIHLGIIPELSKKDLVKKNKKLIKGKIVTCIEHNINFEEQKKHLQSYEFWNKYLGKGGLLCYSDKKGKYEFFKMRDVISLIINSTDWRILETGRIKGDVILKTGKRAVFTFEYRDDKDQFVLGAHGGENGLKFIQFLRENLTKCIICPEENE